MSERNSLLESLNLRANRLMAGVLWFGVVVCFGLASWHDTWAEAILIGVPAALMPVVLMLMLPQSRLTRVSVGLGFMVLSALMVHQAHGMIEMHFSFFVLLAFLLFYRDWAPIVAASALVAVHHVAFNYLQAQGAPVFIFAGRTGFDLVLIHAIFAVFETAVLVYLARDAHREVFQASEMQALAGHLEMVDGKINLDIAVENHRGGFSRRFGEYMAVLLGVIRRVRDGANAIAQATREIANSNLDLSNRTEAQATQLQQTAATMTQITRSAQHNNQSASAARDLASATGKQADHSVQVLDKTVAAMSAISESSRKVTEITTVIDEIAFQTNLLALNAAVEAAHAGEHGRGFAIVANEVRNLAQRSATAAREIKHLIEESTGKVETGTQLVDESGKSLQSIVTSVHKVSALVAEIATASEDQLKGIKQVDASVRSMDEMTQQNAALVEQVAAASETMNHHAQALVTAIGAFRVGAGAPVQAPAMPARKPTAKALTPARVATQAESPPAGPERRAASRPWTSPAPGAAKPPVTKVVGGEEWESF
ncbi:MAG: methyl-accepting chemotaxis protein [Thiotrichales bacterium]